MVLWATYNSTEHGGLPISIETKKVPFKLITSEIFTYNILPIPTFKEHIFPHYKFTNKIVFATTHSFFCQHDAHNSQVALPALTGEFNCCVYCNSICMLILLAACRRRVLFFVLFYSAVFRRWYTSIDY